MIDDLTSVLHPLDPNAFLEHYQARKYFHIARGSAAYYDDFLKIADLDGLLQSENIPAAFITVVRNGVRVPLDDWSDVGRGQPGEHRLAIPERLLDHYVQGATLVLNTVDRVLPPLKALCRNLELELGFPTHANVYITPRGGAGFLKHSDDHEVLIFQLAGKKRWLLHPLDADMVDLELRAGDLLFVPRGLSHEARAEDIDSIHITLGVRSLYAGDLIVELAAIAREDANFQNPVPPAFAPPEVKREFEAAFRTAFQKLALTVEPAQLLNCRARSFAASPGRGWPGRLSDLRSVSGITTDTVVRRRPGIPTVIEKEEKSLSVGFGNKHILVPAFLQVALDKIMGDVAFAVGDLEGFLDGAGKVRLVSEFVTAGLLRIVEENDLSEG